MELTAPLLKIATILIAGIVGGELVGRIKLPKVTGWIGTGILLRMFSLPGFRQTLEHFLPEATALKVQQGVLSFVPHADTLSNFSPFSNFVLGYIAFTVGAALYLPNLRNAGKRLSFLLLGEAIITPIVVFAALMLIGIPIAGGMAMNSQIALLLAAVAIAGAPGTTVLVVQEARARGILTRTLIAAVALIDMVAVGVFVFVLAFFDPNSTGIGYSLVHVFAEFLKTFVIGTVCASVGLLLTRTIVGPAFLGPTMVAVILAAWGAATVFGATGILACTFAGIMVSNLRHDTVRSAEAYLHSIGGVLFATFFTLAGMRLDFTLVPMAAGLVLLYFAARLIGKSISAFTAMSLAGVTDNVRNYLGLALLPHGGVAVGLMMITQDQFGPEISKSVTTVGLAALAINQLLGPSATRFALIQAGEDHKDRARLLDFLQEQRIMVGLDGLSKEEIVKSLAGMLYATESMAIEQEEFVAEVMAREKEETTCLGEGLMIPHAIIAKGEEVKGVLGLSGKGLDLGAPDGPVHAVLLLATPKTERKRHLEILAAFVTAITRDVNMREQLYHARSAAHAYDVLHHEEAEDLNYFLEDAIERAGVRDDGKLPD